MLNGRARDEKIDMTESWGLHKLKAHENKFVKHHDIFYTVFSGKTGRNQQKPSHNGTKSTKSLPNVVVQREHRIYQVCQTENTMAFYNLSGSLHRKTSGSHELKP